jgi:uncharacterized metal-binding protein
MPSGKNHDRITWICLPIIILITLIIAKNLVTATIIGGAFVFSGLMFGPDLDIYSVQYQRWGWFKLIWFPYQKSLKHRSFFSHGFIIGTIVRVLYLSIILFLLAIFLITIAQIMIGFSWNWQQILTLGYINLTSKYSAEAIALFVGLELGAMSHYLADEIASRWQKSKKQSKVSRKKSSPNHRNSSKSNKRKIIK